jgi:hypothetical protein
MLQYGSTVQLVPEPEYPALHVQYPPLPVSVQLAWLSQSWPQYGSRVQGLPLYPFSQGQLPPAQFSCAPQGSGLHGSSMLPPCRVRRPSATGSTAAVFNTTIAATTVVSRRTLIESVWWRTMGRDGQPRAQTREEGRPEGLL